MSHKMKTYNVCMYVALLLAYMRGNVSLCKALVKAGCCLGSMNRDGVTIFNYQVPTKQLLHK
jgi:hypothetical protein